MTDKTLRDEIERILSEANSTLTGETLSELSGEMVANYNLKSERDVRNFLWLNFFSVKSARLTAHRIVAAAANN